MDLHIQLLDCLLLFLGVGDPVLSLALLPSADAGLAFCVCVPTDSFLLSLVPKAFVLFAIGPRVDTETLLLVIEIVAVVGSTIRPCIESFAVKLTVLVHSNILSLVSGGELAVATHLIVDPLALIHRLIGPDILSESLFLSLVELSLI